MDLDQIARRFALQNAVQYGQADAKSCMGKVMGQHPELRARAKDVMPALVAAAETVNAMTPAERVAELEAEAPEMLERKVRARQTGLKPLPHAERGKVVLRFAPNPNGPLSLGHGRGVAVMAQYAEDYEAEVVLRFDDTDPQVKPPLYDPGAGIDAYAWIEEDWEWLAGRKADRVVKASDRIDTYHDHARDLVRTGGAYVCTCDAEAWRDMKNQGHPCPHRDIKPDDVLAAFDDMVAGKYAQGAAVLRVKTDIQHKDPALRDWTAFRIVAADAIHPREAAGEIERHVCWPLLDFESAVEDHLQGVTHIVRGKDLMDSTRKQQFLYQHMGWDYPETVYWGRVSIHEFGKFSTSMMRKGIEAGDFEGWDDPRLPTLRALRRRGYRGEAIRAFWIELGISEKDIAISMENVEAENAKAIDDESPRFFFVPAPHEIAISDVEGRVAEPLVHPSHPDQGNRRIAASEGVVIPGDEAAKAFRLKDLGNVVVIGGRGMFTGTDMDRSLPIIQWLPTAGPDAGAPFTVLRPDGTQLLRIEGLAESAATQRIGDVVQFERYGFVRIESTSTGVWLHG